MLDCSTVRTIGTEHETKQRTVHAFRENVTSELDRAGGAFEEGLTLHWSNSRAPGRLYTPSSCPVDLLFQRHYLSRSRSEL